MLPATTERVPAQTAEKINREIRTETEQNIAVYASASRALIDRRLQELDREWDVERALETNASVAALAGLFLAAVVNRRWLVLPALVAGFLLEHALQGWCPPVTALRRLGFRTRAEIDRERYAMKILRGDFEQLPVRGGESRISVEEILNAEEK